MFWKGAGTEKMRLQRGVRRRGQGGVAGAYGSKRKDPKETERGGD